MTIEEHAELMERLVSAKDADIRRLKEEIVEWKLRYATATADLNAKEASSE